MKKAFSSDSLFDRGSPPLSPPPSSSPSFLPKRQQHRPDLRRARRHGQDGGVGPALRRRHGEEVVRAGGQRPGEGVQSRTSASGVGASATRARAQASGPSPAPDDTRGIDAPPPSSPAHTTNTKQNRYVEILKRYANKIVTGAQTGALSAAHQHHQQQQQQLYQQHYHHQPPPPPPLPTLPPGHLSPAQQQRLDELRSLLVANNFGNVTQRAQILQTVAGIVAGGGPAATYGGGGPTDPLAALRVFVAVGGGGGAEGAYATFMNDSVAASQHQQAMMAQQQYHQQQQQQGGGGFGGGFGGG